MSTIINTHNAQKRGRLQLWVSMPFIYAMIFPTLILHASLFLYQQTAFRLYGLDIIPAKKYIKDVRRFLAYLDFSEKINCWYCSYVNGVFAWAVAIAHETEKMWCPIKNAEERMAFDLPQRADYAEYNSAGSLQEYINKH